ncbi:hypothetical protein ABNT06_06075 [Kosakonia sacchari]|uniref:hypothetical protein n=1 Tax=Kosakonia sacchari TaxID=1158459 RepID=UPI0032D8C859
MPKYFTAGTTPPGFFETSPEIDSVEITDELWQEMMTAQAAGRTIIAGADGMPALEEIPPLTSDIIYEKELNELNSDYEKDVSDLVLKYSRAGLFDGSTEESKKAELFTALQARKTKYSNDLEALDIKYGA